MTSSNPVVYSSYPGFGTWSETNTHYSQAVRVGDIVHISGQGGWDQHWTPDSGARAFPEKLEDELEQAFRMVGVALRHAGVERAWDAVYKTRIYLVAPADDPAFMAPMIAQLRKWCPNHMPAATVVTVANLAFEQMHFEVEVEAYDPVKGEA